MRYWENDGNPIPERRNQYCYVIDPEDGTNPMRTYGATKEEVMDKVAKTAETGQALISRQRQELAQRSPTPTRTPAAPRATMPSADDVMLATADLTDNPGKAPAAVKTLLKAAGFDVDAMQHDSDVRRVSAIAETWERNNPDFPDDERYSRLLMDRATLMVGFKNITAEVLDSAYADLRTMGIRFEGDESENNNERQPPTPPDGSQATRVVRQRGTSYDRLQLSGTPPAPRTQKPKYTRADIDAMNSKQLQDKIKNEPGFVEEYDRMLSTAV